MQLQSELNERCADPETWLQSFVKEIYLRKTPHKIPTWHLDYIKGELNRVYKSTEHPVRFSAAMIVVLQPNNQFPRSWASELAMRQKRL
jgi:hypothetical protein